MILNNKAKFFIGISAVAAASAVAGAIGLAKHRRWHSVDDMLDDIEYIPADIYCDMSGGFMRLIHKMNGA